MVKLVQTYRKANPNLTIGIIAAKNSQIKIYSDWLTSAGITHEQVTKDTKFSMARPGVKVVSAYGAKGLEFNCVIIPMFAEGYFPFKYQTDDPEAMAEFIVKMRNLVYVSMTRAKNLLTITYWGKGGSRFLAELDKGLYEWEGVPMDPIRIKPSKHPIAISPSGSSQGSLSSFLKEKGLEVIDKRNNNGSLWVVGDRSIELILLESKNKYGAIWGYSSKGGNATKHRPGWFTKCMK